MENEKVVLENDAAAPCNVAGSKEVGLDDADKLSPDLRSLFGRILSSDLRVFSLERDAPEPSTAKKEIELRRLLEEKPDQFLYRFYTILKEDEVGMFESYKTNPTVSHFLNKVTNKQNSGPDKKVVRNRRYTKLQQLQAQGDYFSEEEMKKRDPKLHFQMIGQFETEEERVGKSRDQLTVDSRFSTFLLEQSDRTEYMKQQEQQEEEEEEEEEEDEEMLQFGSKEELTQEFRNIMVRRFLDGKDTEHVVYSEIDSNEAYDDLNLRSRDAEDSYFDCESDSEMVHRDEPDDREFNPPPLRPKAIPSED